MYTRQRSIGFMFHVFLLLASCFLLHPASAKKNQLQVVEVQAGTNVPSLGMAFDASYDPTFDNVVPEHKIVTIAITNNSIDILQLNREWDKWILISANGSKHSAITDLRQESPKLFTSLPEKLRLLIEYPLLVQVGETKTIDLLFKSNVDLESFRSVRFESAAMRKAINIVAR